jgi:hypothetical protein
MGEFPYSLGRGESTPANNKKPRKLSPITKSVVFKKGVAIGNKYFLVEIHKSKGYFYLGLSLFLLMTSKLLIVIL